METVFYTGEERESPILEDTLFSDGIGDDLVSLDGRERGWDEPESLSPSVSACFKFPIRKCSNPQKRGKHPIMLVHRPLPAPLLSLLFIIYTVAQRFENF